MADEELRDSLAAPPDRSDDGAALSPIPLASLNMLYNNPAAPFDRNHNGVVDRTNCNDATNLSNCDLGGFDGFADRFFLVGFVGDPDAFQFGA